MGKIKEIKRILRILVASLDASSTSCDYNLSLKLTKAIRKLNRDFEALFIVAWKDRQNSKRYKPIFNLTPHSGGHRFFYEDGKCDWRWIDEFIEINCSLAAKVLLEACENPELKSGVELIIYHELGHIKKPEKPHHEYTLSGITYNISGPPLPEVFAQLYAFNQVKNPIEAMAAALVIQCFVEGGSIKKLMRDRLRYWESSDWDTIYYAGDEKKKFLYHFPLNDVAISEIIKKAESIRNKLGDAS
jgi:hypothetical protein